MQLATDVRLRDAERFVGLPYVPGSFDCGHLVVLVQQQLFGRAVGVLNVRHPTDPRAQAYALLRARGELARRVGQPRTGDAVMFREGAGAGLQWHIGTCFIEAGVVWVLHTCEGGASVLQREADCRRAGLHLDGYFEWV